MEGSKSTSYHPRGPSGFYRKNGIWYEQVIGPGPDMPHMNIGPGPHPDFTLIGPDPHNPGNPLLNQPELHLSEAEVEQMMKEIKEKIKQSPLEDKTTMVHMRPRV